MLCLFVNSYNITELQLICRYGLGSVYCGFLIFPPECHGLFGFHPADEGFRPVSAQVADACHTIGIKNKAEHLSDEVVEFFTLFLIRNLRTYGARRPAVFDTAGSYFAPGSFLVFVTAGATAFLVFWAVGAIKATIADNGGWVFHLILVLKVAES